MNDVLYSPSGGIIDFIVFDKAMKDQPVLKRFKILECDTGKLLLLYECYKGESWQEADRQRFLKQCHALLTTDVTIDTRQVPHLKTEPSGKYRVLLKKDEATEYLKSLQSATIGRAGGVRKDQV